MTIFYEKLSKCVYCCCCWVDAEVVDVKFYWNWERKGWSVRVGHRNYHRGRGEHCLWESKSIGGLIVPAQATCQLALHQIAPQSIPFFFSIAIHCTSAHSSHPHYHYLSLSQDFLYLHIPLPGIITGRRKPWNNYFTKPEYIYAPTASWI